MRVEILLRQIREERNMTLDTLAKLTGMSKRTFKQDRKKRDRPNYNKFS